MGIYAGIVLGISLCLAWGTIFVPRLAGNRRRMINMAIVSLPFVLSYCFLSLGNLPVRLAYVFALLILMAYELIAFAHRSQMKALPALSLLFLFLTAWAPVELHKYAQWMWSGPGIGAGYRYIIGDLELTVIDLLAMFLAIFLSVLLWAGLARRRAPHALVVRSLYTLASTFLSGVAFYYAVPRGGDIGVGVMVMCVLIPGALVAAAITLVTCITVLTVSLIRGGRPPALPAGLDKVKLIEGKE